MNSERILVVGLDGATFDIINPLIVKGALPNLQKLIKEGASGPLKSTIPPVSALAWPSFYTGKNPGKHGIYGFTQLKPGTYSIEPVNASHRHSDAVWSLMSEGGKKGIVMNVPMTYPADAINGYFISGMDSPSFNDYANFPITLKDEITQNVGDYTIECDLWKSLTYKTGKKVLGELQKTEYLRTQTAEYLMKKIDWDYFIIVFVATDRVQHFFWHCMDPLHPRYKEKGAEAFRDSIEDAYRYMDNCLGRLLDSLNDNDTVFVLSDHGMMPFDRILPLVDINEILNIFGYLKFNRIRKGALANVLLKAWKIGKGILPLRIRQYIKRKFPSLRESFHFSEIIDWNSAKAFAPFFDEVTAGGIFINLKGREPFGVVEPGEAYENLRNELIFVLEDLRHPATGQKIIEKVYRREEIYSGDQVSDAPDLVIKWNEQNIFTGREIVEGLWKGSEKKTRKKLDLGEHTGEHAEKGIFIAKGRNIKKGIIIRGAAILDITPTILFLKNLPVLADMDGKVLEEIFELKYLEENAVRFVDPKSDEKTSNNFEYSEHEKQVIKERLRDLGYL